MAVIKMLFQFIIVVFLFSCSPRTDGSGDDLGEDDKREDTTFILSEFNPNYDFIESNSKVKDRNFYWATLVENSTSISQLLKNDEMLSNYLLTVKNRINDIAAQSDFTIEEFAEALKFSDNERIFISMAVKRLVEENANTFINFSNKHCGPSGVFNRFQEINDVSRFHQLIVEEMLMGINQIIDTYVAGKDPKYPDLDRVSYDVTSSEYKLRLKNLISELSANKNQGVLFYQPFLRFAIGTMTINNRDEAGRFTPLKLGENSSAFQNMPNIQWDNYEYSMLVVLGDSPNSPGDLPNISIGGMERCDYAVALYNQGVAPLIAFSGGNVAPFQSEYHEALEMKKYVMDKYGIPENKILIDPHARHTTTNLRNIGRLIFSYGVPTEKKAVISTTPSQSEYLSSDRFSTRCMNEIRHVPMVLYNRLSPRDIEFTPKIEVLHLDSTDPLDP